MGPLETEVDKRAEEMTDKDPRKTYPEAEQQMIDSIGRERYESELRESLRQQAIDYAQLTPDDVRNFEEQGRIDAIAARIRLAMEKDQDPAEIRDRMLRPLGDVALSDPDDPEWNPKSGHQPRLPRIRRDNGPTSPRLF